MRNEVVTMIVLYEIKFVKRTCDSVRSSLSAVAKLATVWSEAAVTTSLHRPDEEMAARLFPRLRASMRSEGQAE